MPLSNGTGDPKGVPANCSHTGFLFNDEWELEGGYWVRKRDSRQECGHEALERSRPPNQKGEPHMLVCTCPKCSITC